MFSFWKIDIQCVIDVMYVQNLKNKFLKYAYSKIKHLVAE